MTVGALLPEGEVGLEGLVLWAHRCGNEMLHHGNTHGMPASGMPDRISDASTSPQTLPQPTSVRAAGQDPSQTAMVLGFGRVNYPAWPGVHLKNGLAGRRATTSAACRRSLYIAPVPGLMVADTSGHTGSGLFHTCTVGPCREISRRLVMVEQHFVKLLGCGVYETKCCFV